jgi:hypothetical protein
LVSRPSLIQTQHSEATQSPSPVNANINVGSGERRAGMPFQRRSSAYFSGQK